MDRLTFQNNQPLAYQLIYNSIFGKRFAHAYLLYGNEGVEIEEYAEFLIQSLLCENTDDSLACGECNNCLRIQKGLYADLVVLSGAEKLIGKKEITDMMSHLNKTGLESRGLKFYLVKQVENATPEALNSLLKFLEEPGNEQTFAIITTNQIDKVMPTILSRCLKVPFVGHKRSEIWSQENNSSEYYLSGNLGKNPTKAKQLLSDEVFLHSLDVFKDSLPKLFEDVHQSLVLVESEGMPDKKSSKEFLTYWLALNIQFLKDLNYCEELPEGWYNNLINTYQNNKDTSGKLLPVFLQAYDQLNRSLNLNLLVEKMFWQIKEVLS